MTGTWRHSRTQRVANPKVNTLVRQIQGGNKPRPPAQQSGLGGNGSPAQPAQLELSPIRQSDLEGDGIGGGSRSLGSGGSVTPEDVRPNVRAEAGRINRMTDLQQNNTDLQQKNADLQKEKAAMQREMDELKRTLDDLEKNFETSIDSMADDSAKIDNLNERLTESDTKLKEASEAKQKADEATQRADEATQKANEAKDTAEENIRRLEAELATREAEIANLEAQLKIQSAKVKTTEFEETIRPTETTKNNSDQARTDALNLKSIMLAYTKFKKGTSSPPSGKDISDVENGRKTMTNKEIENFKNGAELVENDEFINTLQNKTRTLSIAEKENLANSVDALMESTTMKPKLSRDELIRRLETDERFLKYALENKLVDPKTGKLTKSYQFYDLMDRIGVKGSKLKKGLYMAMLAFGLVSFGKNMVDSGGDPAEAFNETIRDVLQLPSTAASAARAAADSVMDGACTFVFKMKCSEVWKKFKWVSLFTCIFLVVMSSLLFLLSQSSADLMSPNLS